MDSRRPGIASFVHVGLVVEDLDETVRFLALLGLDCGEPGVSGGEWIDRIIGLENVTVELVMARAPDGSDVFEVVRFRSPSAGAQEAVPAANRPGLRHVAFKVDDVRGVVERIREAGWDMVGEIVNYEKPSCSSVTISSRRAGSARQSSHVTVEPRVPPAIHTRFQGTRADGARVGPAQL